MTIYHKTLQYHEGGKQPVLPVLKNNEQRRAWLRKYKEWGLCFLWYNTCFGIEPFSRLFARWTLQSNVSPAYG